MYAEIVFNRPLPPYTYYIPDDIKGLKRGIRVEVELGESLTTGIVYKLKDNSELQNLKPVKKIIDKSPILNDDLFDLAEWIARHYICTIGEACWSIIPKGVKKRDVRVKYSFDEDMGVRDKGIVLSADQEKAISEVSSGIEEGKHRVYLIHGVTGSGKTEVYLRLIDRIFEKGLGAILLVPEISLTPQTVRYFISRFGDKLAVLHSRLTRAERINEWFRIMNGEKSIVIGARSAVFAPLKKIGIIIVDEEHETSYKSEETPRYNAKSVAFYRTRKHGGILLLGSATPSVESYFFAKRGIFNLIEMPSRVMNKRLPETRITDLRKNKNRGFLSNTLIKAIEERLKAGEQVILFLNRRGYSPFVYCEECGYVFKCKNCDISLTYHRKMKKLVCHYCGYSTSPPDLCPNCYSEKLNFSGFGTERVENTLNELFPGAVVVRMDTDTLKKRTSMTEILTAFSKKQIDILIGTQIVTKGLHFPNVTLVGVINADIALNFPDFRAAERTFDLITQVSGRAGRGERQGEVIIQTYNPGHYAIQTAKEQDYQNFFVREINFRRAMNYPPFNRIIRLVLRGKNRDKLFNTAQLIVEELNSITGDDEVLGPSSCPISRIKSNYRVHIIIKTGGVSAYRNTLFRINERIRRVSGVYLEVDIDPVSML